MSNPKSAAPKRKLTRQDRHKPGESKRRQNLALQIRMGPRPIIRIGEGIYDVPSQTDGAVTYIVNLIRNTCECKYWRSSHAICKHIYAARMFRSDTEFDAIPEPERSEYRHPAYYERLRSVRRPCIRELLRCIGQQVASRGF